MAAAMFGEAVVEAELGTAVALALTVGAQAAQSSGQGGVVGGDPCRLRPR